MRAPITQPVEGKRKRLNLLVRLWQMLKSAYSKYQGRRRSGRGWVIMVTSEVTASAEPFHALQKHLACVYAIEEALLAWYLKATKALFLSLFWKLTLLPVW